MTRLTLRTLWGHKRRLLGMCSAVVLGVAFLAATLVLTDTMRSGFGGLFAQANAGTDVVLRGADAFGSEEVVERAPVSTSLLDEVRTVGGVAVAEPYVTGAGQIVASDGTPIGGDGPPTMVAGWVTDPDINPYRLREGRVPERAGEVVIDLRSAEVGDLAVGDTTVVLVPESVPVEIVGLVSFGDEDSLSGMTFAATTVDEAQRLLYGSTAVAGSILVRAADGISPEELAGRLASVLPSGTEAITGTELTDEQIEEIGADFLDFFSAFLLVFTGVALVVATFSIYNTFTVIVAQRTRESALVRAIGASRAQVLRSTVLEAALIGAVASAVGIAAGIGLASLMGGVLDGMGMGSIAADLRIETSSLAWAAALGLGVTLVAALAPAVRASRVPPLAAMRDVAVDRSASSRPRAFGGLAALVAGSSLLVTATSADEGAAVFQRVGLGAVLVIVGMVVTGPVVARVAATVIGAPLAVGGGFAGELARNNARRDPRRTAGTAAALMVGVGVVTLFTTFGASVKATVDDSVGRAFGGDLVISSPSWSGSGLSPELAGRLGTLPEVGSAAAIGLGAAEIGGREAEFVVVDPPAFAPVLDLDLRSGSIADLADDALAVSERRADDEGWLVGHEVPVRFADGAREVLAVGAIYRERDLVGDLVLPEAAWVPHTARPRIDTVLVEAASGVDLAVTRAAVEPIVAELGRGQVQDRDEYVASLGAEIDSFLTVVYVLLAVSVVIALMGIANTLSLSVHERTRELGLLRAVGQTRRQLRAMVRGESVIISLFGTVGGVGLGLFLAWALVRAVAATEGMGTFVTPVGPLAVVVAVGAAVGLVASLRPARRAARLDVLQAIATD